MTTTKSTVVSTNGLHGLDAQPRAVKARRKEFASATTRNPKTEEKIVLENLRPFKNVT